MNNNLFSYLIFNSYQSPEHQLWTQFNGRNGLPLWGLETCTVVIGCYIWLELRWQWQDIGKYTMVWWQHVTWCQSEYSTAEKYKLWYCCCIFYRRIAMSMHDLPDDKFPAFWANLHEFQLQSPDQKISDLYILNIPYLAILDHKYRTAVLDCA